MAVPRVFISSTYYDLKQVRNNIADFIKSLGYEPVMHEKSGVAYTQNVPLEVDCYTELSGCDIVICIIGNHFGSVSSENDFSITMNELNTAIKTKKKIYVFISNDVFIENRTYLHNKDSGAFKSAYTDDIKIHEFICNLKDKLHNSFITSFETTDQIIEALRGQFAGLFQNLLSREASLTEGKTIYDLQETADTIKDLIDVFGERQNDFFMKFDSTIFTDNAILKRIRNHLGMKETMFFAKNLSALDEFMKIVDFSSEIVDEIDDERKYVYKTYNNTKTLILKSNLFDECGNIMDIRNKQILDNSIVWIEEENPEYDLPF